MSILDIFNTDAFSVVSLTDAILKAPHKPGRIGQLGLFRSRGIPTTTVVVEEKDGRLSLITSTPRGGPATTIGEQKRTARSFVVPHLVKESTVQADQVQGVRAFGSEDATASVQALVNERLTDMRAMHEVTLEHLRIGAMKGQVLDGDGSTVLFNLFTEFNVSQQTYDVDFSADDIRNQVVAIQRLIEVELGAEPVSAYRAFCGSYFFDQMLASPQVRNTFLYNEGQVLRTDLRGGFPFGGVTWEEYRGSVGGVNFIASDEAYVFPEGSNIFQTYFAPADFIETVNTIGLPIYAKQAPDPSGFNRYMQLHTQSNPLALCLRPRAVVKATFST